MQVVNILMTAVTDKALQHHLCHIVQLAASRETAAALSTPRANHLLVLVSAIETAWASGQQALQSRPSKTWDSWLLSQQASSKRTADGCRLLQEMEVAWMLSLELHGSLLHC